MQETPYLHRVPVSSPTLYPALTTNVYIIESQGEALIIDAGYDNPEALHQILQTIEAVGSPRVKAIVLTHHHRDHCPGAQALATRLNCPVLCHALEKEQVAEQITPVPVNTLLEEGDILEVGDLQLQVLHTPGHARGHISLWLEQNNILFAGDNIVTEGTTWIGPPDGDMIDYLATLRRLQSLNPALIAPGHGEIINNPQEKIQFFIDRRLEREQQLLQLLTEHPRTVEDLLSIIYKNQVHPSVIWVAERTIQGHLQKLLAENKIHQKNGLYSC